MPIAPGSMTTCSSRSVGIVDSPIPRLGVQLPPAVAVPALSPLRARASVGAELARVEAVVALLQPPLVAGLSFGDCDRQTCRGIHSCAHGVSTGDLISHLLVEATQPCHEDLRHKREEIVDPELCHSPSRQLPAQK